MEGVWGKDENGNLIPFKVNPHPIIWIISPNQNEWDFCHTNLIYAPKFGFEELKAYLKFATFEQNSFTSVYHWSKERNNKASYEIIDEQIKRLEEQLERDNKIGSLTKKKIDRLNRQYSEDLRIYEEFLDSQNNTNIFDSDDDIFDMVFNQKPPKKINQKPPKKIKITLTARIEAEKGLNNNLIIISGKAGSGKTFEMLLLIKKNYEQEKKGYYLTYNKLLANDTRYIINQYQRGEYKTAIKTLHSFFFNLSGGSKGGLRILSMMTITRLKKLKKTQEERYESVTQYLQENMQNNKIDIDELKPYNFWDKGLVEYFLSFIAFARKNNISANIAVTQKYLKEELEKYSKRNLDAIESKLNQQCFLEDYYEVLRNILLAKQNSKALYRKLGVSKFSNDEWEQIVKDKIANYSKTEEDFCKMINRSFGGTLAKGKVLFIDEAQDCHPLERNILLSIWGERNIVVCTGGKEQLIRHSDECNWKINGATDKKLHNIISIEKRNRTYRMKPSLVKLCNFIAKEFEINLDLSSHNTNTDDQGCVTIELYDSNYSKLKEQVEKLIEKGNKNDLTPYESILFMGESSANSMYETLDTNEQVSIDNVDNLHYSKNKIKSSNLSKIIEIDNLFYYNHTNKTEDDQDKDKEDESNDISSDTYRSIFYESCRGLEAWSAVCLDLDLFFQNKYDEDDAAIYLSDDFLLTENERREKYAATWVLMALTRAIDTLYIHINDPNSKFGRVLQKYIEQS